MINFLKRDKKDSTSVESKDQPEKKSWFSKLKQGLQKTRQSLTGGIADAVLGKKELNADVLEEIETYLLTADVGVAASQAIIEDLREGIARKSVNDGEALMAALKAHLFSILDSAQKPFVLRDTTTSVLMVGINGAGKTTTIGKLAHYFQSQNKTILLGAGDTFRAAAVEQLKAWGARNDVPVIAQATGADSASVAFDALSSAKARALDVVLVDTAGRLHTQNHLMEELKKVTRVMGKVDSEAPHEVLLVLDASIGQNALLQAMAFHEAVGVTGIVLTKLDGTAKGGIIFAIAQQLQLPIYFIGVGEGIEDLKPFDAREFIEALF